MRQLVIIEEWMKGDMSAKKLDTLVIRAGDYFDSDITERFSKGVLSLSISQIRRDFTNLFGYEVGTIVGTMCIN